MPNIENNTMSTFTLGGKTFEVKDASARSDIQTINTVLNTKADTSDMSNYYTKSETYNKTEVDSLIDNIDKSMEDALALKADSANVTALETRMTAVEGDVEDVTADLTLLSSPTRNINTAEIGRYRSLNGLPEYINNVNYAGMDDMVACDASTEYTATFYNMGIGTIRASYYASDKSYISEYHASSRSTLTFTTPNNASYVHVWIYNGSSVTIGDNSHIQIEKGANSTAYVNPVSAKDVTARSDIDAVTGKVNVNTKILTKNELDFVGRYVCHIGASYNRFDTIPSQSVFDVRRAQRLGFKAIELNVQKTSDGKFITTHGVGGKFGAAFASLDDSDIENTLISDVTLDYIKTYVRYKSTLDKYKVAPSTLEESLTECHRCGIFPLIQNVEGVIDIADEIMGKENYALGTYQEDRPNGYDGICWGWLAIGTEQGIIDKCNALGGAYIAGISTTDAVYSSFTDSDWKSLFEALHENGFRSSSAYMHNPATSNKFMKLGMDHLVSGHQIPDIESGNICNLLNNVTWDGFDTTGTISNAEIQLANGQTIKPHDTFESVFLGGGAIHIRFNGSVYITMGHHITSAYVFESDGTEDIFISTYFDQEAPTFVLTATDATTVYELTYKASEL